MPLPAQVRTILLDIEGTTTPIDFVYKTLFPFARNHAAAFLEAHRARPDLQSDLALLQQEYREETARGNTPPAWRNGSSSDEIASALSYIHWLMDQDRKSTALKSLQGKLWEEFY